MYLNLSSTDGEVNGVTSVREEGIEIYSITGTVDLALTDHLTARGEIRWDNIEGGPGGFGFFENSDGNSDNQTVGALEVIYAF